MLYLLSLITSSALEPSKNGSKYIHDMGNGMIQIDPCDNPTMIRNLDGECVCPTNYFSDNPISDRGCWICRPRCGYGMDCIYPGNCTCYSGYTLVEWNRCEIPIPKVSNIMPRSGRQLTKVQINFAPFHDFIPEQFFCRFGGQTVNGSLINQTYAECKVPIVLSKSSHEVLALNFSFDGSNWSSYEASFVVTRIPSYFGLLSFMFAIVVGGFIVYIIVKRKNVHKWREEKDEGQNVPFISHEDEQEAKAPAFIY